MPVSLITGFGGALLPRVPRPEWDRRSGIPEAYCAGQGGWDEAAGHLSALDPHRVFGNGFLDRLI